MKNNLIAMYNLVKEHGGASFQIETGELNPTDGFMVSLAGNAETVDVPKTLNEWQDIILDYLLKKSTFGYTIVALLAYDTDLYLGAWVENDKLYLDVSQKIIDFETAEKLGHERNQIAIFDNVNKQSFYL